MLESFWKRDLGQWTFLTRLIVYEQKSMVYDPTSALKVLERILNAVFTGHCIGGSVVDA